MVIVRQHEEVSGELCGPCVDSVFSSFSTTTLLIGWCGFVSFIAAPIYLALNLYNYGLAGTLGGRRQSRATVASLIGAAPFVLLGLVVLAVVISNASSAPLPTRVGRSHRPAKEPPENPLGFPTYRSHIPITPELNQKVAKAIRFSPNPTAGALAQSLWYHVLERGEIPVSVVFHSRNSFPTQPTLSPPPGNPIVLLVGNSLGPREMAPIEDEAVQALTKTLTDALGAELVTLRRGRATRRHPYLAVNYRMELSGQTFPGERAALGGILIKATLRFYKRSGEEPSSVHECSGTSQEDTLASRDRISQIRRADEEYPLLARSAFLEAIRAFRSDLIEE